jgi:hypothetical protein
MTASKPSEQQRDPQPMLARDSQSAESGRNGARI